MEETTLLQLRTPACSAACGQSRQPRPRRRPCSRQPKGGSCVLRGVPRSRSGPSRRRRHVASLLGDPLFRAVEKQKDVYEVGFACAAAGLPPNLQLLLSLPPAFPDAAPLVSLKSPGVPVAHPWLDPATMRIVGHPRLGADWITREQSCTLGKVVAEIVREMQLNPPRALGDRSDGRTLNRAGAGSNGNLAPTSGTPGTPPGPSFLRSAAPPEYSGRAPSTSPSSIRTGSANLYRDESSASGKLKFSENGSPQRTSSWAAVSALSDPANLFRSPQPPSPTNLGRSTSPLGRTPAMSEIEIPGIDRMSWVVLPCWEQTIVASNVPLFTTVTRN